MSADPAEGHLARFMIRPDVADVAGRYGDWASSNEGIGLNLQLALLAMRRVYGQVSLAGYRHAVRNLRATTAIPLADFLILAECQLELLRFAMSSSGEVRSTSSLREADGEAA